MEEKIIIKRVENSCDLFMPELHSVGANLQSNGRGIVVFSGHKKDELGNFNAAAHEAFEEYLKDKDLTPKKNQNLYSGKIVFIDTKHEGNEHTFGTVIYNVIDGLIPELCLLNMSKDLRIEKNMTCSDLYKRVIDMYFNYCGASWFDKIMYANTSRFEVK